MPSILLIAETDYHTLDGLHRVLCDQIPDITIDTCSYAEDLTRNLKNFSYDAIALSPRFIRPYRALTHQYNLQLLAPLLVTVYQSDLTLAYTALDADAFDLIVKPIVAHDATQSVRLALWQNKLLRLLASKEQMASRFHQHTEVFPPDAKAEFMNMLERTCQTLATSLRLLERIENEQTLFDMVAFVGRYKKQRALDRLLNMHREGSSH